MSIYKRSPDLAYRFRAVAVRRDKTREGPEQKAVPCVLSPVCKKMPVWMADRVAQSRAGKVGENQLKQNFVGYTENFDD